MSRAPLYRAERAATRRRSVRRTGCGLRFYLLTLTAPSFDRVHCVPRDGGQRVGVCGCGCGVEHAATDARPRGVPLDGEGYDYAAQVAWNRDVGLLWDRTRRRMHDRWDALEYFIVREW